MLPFGRRSLRNAIQRIACDFGRRKVLNRKSASMGPSARRRTNRIVPQGSDLSSKLFGREARARAAERSAR